jgi:hypothetical protein
VKSETRQIAIVIDERDALSIINSLQKGLDKNLHASVKENPEYRGAIQLWGLLMSNFRSSVSGIHTVD